MPVGTQVKMQRVLEMREITPLGTNDVRPVDLRVVAAAKIEFRSGRAWRFREYLHYRLHVVTISITPLRERPDDIPLLFSLLLRVQRRAFAEKSRRSARKWAVTCLHMPGPAMSASSRTSWKGLGLA